MIAVVVALREELRPLWRCCSATATEQHGAWRFHKGLLKGKEILLLVSGIGWANAHAAATALFRHYNPSLVISAGLAGGLKDGLNTGDIVLGSKILGVAPNADSQSGACFNELFALTLPSPDRKPPVGFTVYCGGILSVDEVATHATEKRTLGEQTGALVVEMETLGVASVAAANGAPFLAVRVVGDTVNDNLPPEMKSLLCGGGLDRKRLVVAAACRPAVLLEIRRLHARSRTATGQLARFIDWLLAEQGLLSSVSPPKPLSEARH